ncbi:MAG: hypothetical protein J6Q31_02235 [Alistipes sp.]|nr:hypothetical protein [Alistipes sp.]
MANLRILEKEIDYRLEEFVFDCEMAISFQPSKEEAVVGLMEKAVDLRNVLYVKANNPTEPKNASLVKKYYAAFRRDMVSSFTSLFNELSEVNAAN